MIFVYSTKNLINDKVYVGVHKTDNIDDGYLGSGTILQMAIKKYGRENFVRNVISFHASYESALSMERDIVDESFVSRHDTYNVTIGGGMPPILAGTENPRYGKPNPEASERMKLRNPMKGKLGSNSPSYRKVVVKDTNGETFKVSIDDERYLGGSLVAVNKDMVTVRNSDGDVISVSVNDPRFLSGEYRHVSLGLKRTWNEQQRREIYNTRRGRKRSQEVVDKMSGREPWNKGISIGPMDENTKRKISKSNLGKSKEVVSCPYCCKIGGKPVMKRFHFENCRSLI